MNKNEIICEPDSIICNEEKKINRKKDMNKKEINKPVEAVELLIDPFSIDKIFWDAAILVQSSPVSLLHLWDKTEQSSTVSCFKEVRRRIPSGRDVKLGQSEILMAWIDERFPMPSGRDVNLGHFLIIMYWSDERFPIIFDSDTKFWAFMDWNNKQWLKIANLLWQ